MSNLRGIFLELLTYKFLQFTYSEKQINHESILIIGDFVTNPIDFVIKRESDIDCYECKFSSYSIKKNQIDIFIGLKNKSIYLNVSLVLFESRQDTLRILNSNNKINYILNEDKYKINFINLEDFVNKNPFE